MVKRIEKVKTFDYSSIDTIIQHFSFIEHSLTLSKQAFDGILRCVWNMTDGDNRDKAKACLNKVAELLTLKKTL